MKYSVKRSDILIIGGGLAGLRAADAAADAGCSVLVVSKGPRCSARVSGFNAPVGPDDSEELFLSDIMTSGETLNDPRLGQLLATRAAKEAYYLESLGLHFQKTADGAYHLLQPLRCTVPRLVHDRTLTGAEAERVLMASLTEKGVAVEESVTVTQILVAGGAACGAVGYRTGSDELTVYVAKAVVLATGGCGGLYDVSTYPKAICGSSAALAYGAGAALTNMEFIEFEPCCMMDPPEHRGRGISSTMLFVGGCLRNSLGENIIKTYFRDLSEISKSTLSQAIWKELQAGRGTPHGGLWYDLTAVPREVLEEHEEHLLLLESLGFDLSRDYLEVAPAAHTCLGGVMVDAQCRSTVPGLYAAGEAVGNLHGANRIGGNAGAEVFVFGAIAGAQSAAYAKRVSLREQEALRAAEDFMATAAQLRSGTLSPASAAACIRRIISEGAPLLRCEENLCQVPSRLRETLNAIDVPQVTPQTFTEYWELWGMAQTAHIIAAASGLRRESRGVFNRSDYPAKDEKYNGRNARITKINGSLCACLSENKENNDHQEVIEHE